MHEASQINSAAGALDRATLLALMDASRSINDELDPAEICQRVAAHAASVLDTEGSSVLLHDAERQELVFYTVIGAKASEAVQSKRFPDDRGIAGQVVRTGRSIRIDDVRQNRHFYPGIDVLTQTRTRNLMAAPLVHHNTVVGVVEVINRKNGEPFGEDDLRLLELFANLVAGAARNAQLFDRLNQENRGLRESIPLPEFIGCSPSFESVLALCRKVASSSTTVLLTGETGTGKEMAARAIYAMSPRAGGPFVAVNCAALPESLMESELFGHEAGAFTGASSQRPGKFELAHRGTLLLDEIGELDLSLQAKLLRVLETGEITRIGGSQPTYCDVRLITATNRELRAEVESGAFREDLFYRCNVFPIRLPALRERLDDLPLLAEHLVAQVAPSLGINPPKISEASLAALMQYHWPGNVRELRNVMERAALLATDTIETEHLPPEVTRASASPGAGDAGSSPGRTSTSALAEQEMRLVRDALEQNDWNQSAAARQLGISRDILRYRVKRYGLRKP